MGRTIEGPKTAGKAIGRRLARVAMSQSRRKGEPDRRSGRSIGKNSDPQPAARKEGRKEGEAPAIVPFGESSSDICKVADSSLGVRQPP